jgi:hypothetical protein
VGKVNGLANGTLVDARAAAYEYKEVEYAAVNTEAARTPTVHWRGKHTGFKRTALGANRRPRSKVIISSNS